MRYRRMPIEVESPEEVGYGSIRCNLAESSMRDRVLGDLGLEMDLAKTILQYGDHRGHRFMRLGFGWPTPPEFEEGLANISASLRAARS